MSQRKLTKKNYCTFPIEPADGSAVQKDHFSSSLLKHLLFRNIYSLLKKKTFILSHSFLLIFFSLKYLFQQIYVPEKKL